MLFHHIHFAVGLKKDCPCWNEGYLNSGNTGPLKYMNLRVDKKENITILNYSLEDGKIISVNEKLDIDSFISKYAGIFKTDDSALNEVLIMSIYDTAQENLSDEGAIVIRKGKDYCGEINIADLPKLNSKIINKLRVVFVEYEKVNGSGDYVDDQEMAGVFIPIL